MEDMKNQNEGRILERFQAREWAPGDIYSPHDLSPTEMKKWSKRWSPSNDAFDALNINPLEHYKVQPPAIFPGDGTADQWFLYRIFLLCPNI